MVMISIFDNNHCNVVNLTTNNGCNNNLYLFVFRLEFFYLSTAFSNFNCRIVEIYASPNYTIANIGMEF